MATELCVAVIGSGNIGSRHLQGLARMTSAAHIFACDPSAQSLALARDRVAEIKPAAHLKFSFVESLALLPGKIDLAIVATGAAYRRAIVDHLLQQHEISAFVLEKFLFQSQNDHTEIQGKFEARKIKAFVNTPRRAWPAYQKLTAQLAGTGPFSMLVEINRTNGMATNAIHFIDLAAYLTATKDGFSMNAKSLRAVAGVSRHADAVEFDGILEGISARGDHFTLRGRTDSVAPHVIFIASADRRIVIHETQAMAYVSTAASGWKLEPEPFPILRQSDLTGLIADEILTQGTASLPTYAESELLHRQCLSVFLEALGKDREDANAIAPVT